MIPHRGAAGIMASALLSLSAVTPAGPAWAQAGSAASAPNRPTYQLRRFDEDWSILRGVDLGETDDPWDRLKFIRLTSDQSVWLSLGGQLRERAEYFRQFQFGASEPEQSDAYLLSRFRLSVDLHVTRYFRMPGNQNAYW